MKRILITSTLGYKTAELQEKILFWWITLIDQPYSMSIDEFIQIIHQLHPTGIAIQVIEKEWCP